MAEIDDKTLRQLADAIKGMSRMDMFPRTQDDKNFDALVQKMDDLEKGNTANTKKMVESYDKALKDAGIAKEIKNLRDVLEAQDQYKAMRSIVKTISDKNNLRSKDKADLDQVMLSLQRQAESAGKSLEEMGVKTTVFFNRHIGNGGAWEIKIKDSAKTIANLDKEATKLGRALDEAADETERFSKRVEFARGMLGKIGNVAKTVAKDFIRLAEQEQRFAQQNAVADAGWIEGVERMQISTLDYMKILKDTRRESLAMRGAGIDFKESLIAGQKGLLKLTASSTEAAQMSAAFHKNMSRMGVSQEDLGDAVAEQTKLYKENYRVLGYSVEEFAKLTEELINDQGMRSTLLGLQEKERKAYIMGVQQRMAEYQTMGYTIERAKELQKTFQALNQMNPKERMKQAAKTRAMMGAMGMGAEGEELFNLQTRYRTMNAEEKAAADKRMAEIQSRAASQFGAMSGAGTSLGQSMSMQMMAEKTGFGKIAETFETASGEGLKVNEKQLDEMKRQADLTNEIGKTSHVLLRALDTKAALQNTALTSVAMNLATGIGGLMMTNVAGFASVITAMGGFSPRGGLAGKGGKGPKGKGPTGGKAAGKGAGKILGKGAMKSLAKKIPFVGLGAGLMFGAERLMSGDILGAGGEVLSGLLGATGVGAPLSMAIDAGLMARDIKNANNPMTQEGQMAKAPEAELTPQADATAQQLLETLKSIDMFLRENANLTDENAKALSTVGTAIRDNAAFANSAKARAAT